MNIKLAFALFSILLFSGPGYAQNPCVDCLKAAQEHLKQCRDEAITHEDKNSCAGRQLAKTKACENAECVIEKITSQNNNDVLPQKK